MRAYWCCYYSYLDYMKRLDDAERGQLFTALITYAKDGEVLSMSDKVGVAFDGIRTQIDRDSEEYETKCMRLAINGSIGGKQKVANATKCKQKVANGCKEKEKEKEKDIEREKRERKRSSFSIPTEEEVRAYCEERGNNIDAGTFIDFYKAKDWKIGKDRMTDWKAAIRTWERREVPKSKYAGFKQRSASETNWDDISIEL